MKSVGYGSENQRQQLPMRCCVSTAGMSCNENRCSLYHMLTGEHNRLTVGGPCRVADDAVHEVVVQQAEVGHRGAQVEVDDVLLRDAAQVLHVAHPRQRVGQLRVAGQLVVVPAKRKRAQERVQMSSGPNGFTPSRDHHSDQARQNTATGLADRSRARQQNPAEHPSI